MECKYICTACLTMALEDKRKQQEDKGPKCPACGANNMRPVSGGVS